MTECERGTQRKSERLIEHFASIALFGTGFKIDLNPGEKKLSFIHFLQHTLFT